ncbi:MAG: GWxTD domain-containing protein [candidate division KSB1 bacterium]|nr:GWxTD domain-containing protein [candidate division KSB1 bacterium]
MKKLFICLFIVMIFKSGTAQFPYSQNQQARNMFGRDLFLYKLFNLADRQDSTKSRLDCHVALVNDILTFYKVNDAYRADFELSAVVYQGKDILAQKSLRDSIKVELFDKTNSRTPLHRYSMRFSLDPGKYKVLINLSDGKGNQLLEEEKNVELKDFSGRKLQVSSLIFADKADCNQDPPDIQPNLRDSFQDMNSSFSLFVHLATPQQGDSLRIETEVIHNDGQQVMNLTAVYPLKAADRLVDLCVSMKEYIRKPGEYRVVFRAQTENEKVVKRNRFSVFWGGAPGQGTDLNTAIEQLAVVVDNKSLDSMRTAQGERKRQLFERFWEQRDPTPDTEVNELKQEYYQRAEFAIRNFSEVKTGRVGWQTDRGRIYMKYGKPDDVERNRNSMTGPVTEIWTYEELSRRYIFVDRENNGVFRLYRIE